jgi:tetratricopeptide (TPR) repeat protein
MVGGFPVNNQFSVALALAVAGLTASVPLKAGAVGASSLDTPSSLQSVANLSDSPAMSDLAPDPLVLLGQAQQQASLTDAQQDRVDDLLISAQDKIDARDYPAAISFYEQAAQIDQSNPRLYSGIGYLQSQTGNYAAAVTAYQRAIALDPDNISFRYGLAYSLYELERYDDAIAAYQDIIDSDRRQADAYLGIGSIQLQMDNPEAALATYEQLVQVAPNNAQVYLALGSLYYQQKKYDEALSNYQRAVQIDRNLSDAYVGMGDIEMDRGNNDQALDHLRRAIAIEPRNADAQFRIGKILREQGKDDEAYDYLLRAVRINPDFTAAHALIGDLQLERQNYFQAVLSYRQLVLALPSDPGAHYNLGLALYGQGLEDQAMYYVEIAKTLYREQENQEGIDRAQALLDYWQADGQ